MLKFVLSYYFLSSVSLKNLLWRSTTTVFPWKNGCTAEQLGPDKHSTVLKCYHHFSQQWLLGTKTIFPREDSNSGPWLREPFLTDARARNKTYSQSLHVDDVTVSFVEALSNQNGIIFEPVMVFLYQLLPKHAKRKWENDTLNNLPSFKWMPVSFAVKIDTWYFNNS